ncbi:hypothetical protein [Vibrio cholerae]|uniref:hypothetical protein n=1 Tax=Vibrio cholerae TaxID=666 RepID=UPI000B231DFA|nr:hypothetical protein [Vibrio cholerae]
MSWTAEDPIHNLKEKLGLKDDIDIDALIEGSPSQLAHAGTESGYLARRRNDLN